MNDLSLNHKTKLRVKPVMDQQLISISEDCLILQHFHINLALTMGWGGALFFWLIGFPIIIFQLIDPLLPPYGYNDDGTVASLSDLSLLYFLSEYFIALPITVVFSLAITLGLSYYNLRTLKRAFSPITFNRKTQRVSMYSQGKKEEVEWSKLSCSLVNVNYASGYVMHQSMVLQLNNVTQSGIKVRIEASLLADALDDKEHEGAEGNWEYIRQYMEQGPEQLTLAASPVIGLNHLDKQPMYSYNIKDSLKGNWFWPILKQKDRSKIRNVFSYLYWPIKVAFFIPNLLTDWLWRKMCLRTLKDSKATPQYSMKHCGKQLLTTNDAESVSTVEEASTGTNLRYSEIKKRLQEVAPSKFDPPSFITSLLISLAIYILIFLFFYYFDDWADYLLGWFFD